MEPAILLSQPPKYWDDRCAPPRPSMISLNGRYTEDGPTLKSHALFSNGGRSKSDTCGLGLPVAQILVRL